MYLYIPSGKTLTSRGANASGQTGAGAGIELAAGNTLFLLGGGTVSATGGNAANGGNGGNGSNAECTYDVSILGGSGGNGGNGGGGAGAGIGTRGGNGGNGGTGGQRNGSYGQETTQLGVDGNAGSAGSTAGAMGKLYMVTSSVNLSVTGGNAGSNGTGGNGGKTASQHPGSNVYMAAGGGGGAAGGFGGAACYIGTGGPGGGGGGGGAAGNVAWVTYSGTANGYYYAGAKGGKSTEVWNVFATDVNNGNQYDDKFLRLDNDITITSMAGSSSDNSFRGTFDGNGHTLTFNKGTDSEPFAEEYCAPFRYIGGATIRNLKVAGDIFTSSRYAAGLVGSASEKNTISNCVSSVAIHSTYVGNASHGGFIGNVWTYRSTTIQNCVFNGKLLGSSTSGVGGFIGMVKSSNEYQTSQVNDCLFVPAEVNVDNGGCFFGGRTFSAIIILNNCYYTETMGTAQGKQAYALATAPANLGGMLSEYSMVKSYENGIFYDGTYYVAPATVSLADLADNGPVLAEADGMLANVTYNRTLSATQNSNGLWTSRAYTLCLPYELDLSKMSENVLAKAYRLAYVKDREYIFTNEFGHLSAGVPYLVVVYEGELKLDASHVVVHSNPSDGYQVFEWSDDPAVSGKEVGLWRGTFSNISNDEAAELKAHTLSKDGKFRRISNAPGYQGAYIGTFRAFFMPYESDGYYAFTTKFVYQENGEEDTEIQDFPADDFEGDNDYTDETTGIGTIHTIDSDGTHRYYDMQGRQLRQRPAKGLYIENGKIQFNK